jgi:predicted dehydrogenase
MKTRRQLLRRAALSTAAVSGFPTIVKASALGLEGITPPSDRVTLATIGVGWMGDGHLDEFFKVPDCRIVAVCDLDDEHLSAAKFKIDKKYGDQGCATYHAFEEVMARRDIDAVSIATPDHWHGMVASAAARARKDIYCEKPIAHNFNEGLAMVREAKKHGVIWQTGSWQRSVENFRRGCELVRNGYIGKVTRVEVGLPSGHFDFAGTKGQTAFSDPPSMLLYDRWLGPAPEAPYCPARVHKNWRWNLDYAGGQLMDWIGHHGDIAHWGMGYDETGPLEVEGKGEYPARAALWNTATKFRVTCTYPQGVTFILAGGEKDIKSGTKWIGEKGWVHVDRGRFETEPGNLKSAERKPADMVLPKSPGHYQQFISSVKTRERTLTPADVALRSATPGFLGQIAMLTGRKIRWDAVEQRIVDDAEAEKLLGRDMRSPFRL